MSISQRWIAMWPVGRRSINFDGRVRLPAVEGAAGETDQPPGSQIQIGHRQSKQLTLYPRRSRKEGGAFWGLVLDANVSTDNTNHPTTYRRTDDHNK